ncbi:MAG TPA: M20/M25/M40 family metallo-hydrolase [Vicinamibacterales bacterium]|nr:M20/M25/M40 family metallo-hydrolase [Vicinamibacterales bacterium]
MTRIALVGSAFATVVVVAVVGLSVAGAQPSPPPGPAWIDAHRADAARLIKEAQADQFAWNRLAELTDTYGHRLSGSDNLTRAIAWAVETMNKDGLENVHTEKVMVPRWVRGNESVEITEPTRQVIPMLGLGGSVATPPAGLEAEVIVVKNYDELNQRAAEVKGKIVLYNAVYTNYGQTNVYRTGGATAAARHGALASLVRAIGPTGLRTPHTGGMTYAEGVTRIPTAAISAEDAERIQRLADRGQRVRARLRMEARFEADVESANVVGEIRGSELPDEVVLVGGHFDSWDLGTGASDDAVGCVVTWEAARLMKKLGIRPRRTVRVVLFTNEENGLRGGNAYRDLYLKQAEQHVLAIESDSGVFAPARLGFTGSDAAQRMMRDVGSLLTPLGLQEIGPGGGGADIGPIATAGKVPMLAYSGDSTRYFTIHHTPADTIDRIAPEEVSKAAAALAVVTYVVADAKERLPK